MNEIEKLYENCEIKKKKEYGCTDTWEICYHQKEYPNCKGCPFWKLIDIKYPPFTAEKQLKIMKFIIKKGYYCDEKETEFNGEKYCFCVDYVPFKRVWNTFEEAIAKYINDIWQDLTEEEKEQIRGILNGN